MFTNQSDAERSTHKDSNFKGSRFEGSKPRRSKSRRSYVFLVHAQYAFSPPALMTIWGCPHKARNFISEHVERHGGSITEWIRTAHYCPLGRVMAKLPAQYVDNPDPARELDWDIVEFTVTRFRHFK